MLRIWNGKRHSYVCKPVSLEMSAETNLFWPCFPTIDIAWNPVIIRTNKLQFFSPHSLSLSSSSFIIPSIVALWLHISLVKNCKFSQKLFRYNNESSMPSKSFFAAAATASFGYCSCFASNGTVAIGFILRIIGIFPGLNISMTMSIDLPRTRNGK